MTKRGLAYFFLAVVLAALGAVAGCIVGALVAMLLTDCNVVEGECNVGFLLGAFAGAVSLPIAVFWFGSRARLAKKQD